MDFLNRVVNSPQVQQALSDFVPGLRSKVDQIFGIHRPDNTYTNYELNIISPEETTGPMPVVATPIGYDYMDEGVVADYPPGYGPIIREAMEREKAARTPSGPSPMMFPP
tara:strand:+ start:376 stop:705 length:330 start_codon:yes stop_codon:yes gene_type:complete